MKFINYLKSIDGISIYPFISLVIFMTVFIIAVIYVWTADKDKFKSIAQIPLDDEKN